MYEKQHSQLIKGEGKKGLLFLSFVSRLSSTSYVRLPMQLVSQSQPESQLQPQQSRSLARW